MNILVLCKRQYTGKDLLDDQYGRLFEIPKAIASLGHEVVGLTLSYRRRRSGVFVWAGRPRIIWHSVNMFPFGFVSYCWAVHRIIRRAQPEVVWAGSDVLQLLLGYFVSRVCGVPLAVDIYDNYESFGLTRLPGMKKLLRAICRRASALTVVSNTLSEYIGEQYGASAQRWVITNGVDSGRFFPRSSLPARERFNLPRDGKLIGTAGSIAADRGIEDLFEAFIALSREYDDLWLAYAGPADKTPARFQHERIINLGVLPHEEIPWFLSSLNVAIVCNRDSAFGRYCFPQKFSEITACGVPVVAAAVGDVRQLLADREDSLYSTGDWVGLAGKIRGHLANPRPIDGHIIPSWEESAARVAEILERSLVENKSKLGYRRRK